ncbi:hypothetical protein [Chlorogloeopsis fritschii]|uniref:hypothetical protein n=1 Tax=Chlorogloeopsis fritschii TaxID=1124 RepID=UPI0023FA0227|nr:hypothetical protein [Chlorogloeopsis fritschii]
MRFLTLIEVLELHCRVIEQSGGAFGIRDVGLLESAIPRLKTLSTSEKNAICTRVMRDRSHTNTNFCPKSE